MTSREELVQFAQEVCEDPQLPPWVRLEEIAEGEGLDIKTSAQCDTVETTAQYHVRVEVSKRDMSSGERIEGKAVAFWEKECEGNRVYNLVQKVASWFGLGRERYSCYSFIGSGDALQDRLRKRAPGLYQALLAEALQNAAQHVERTRQRYLEDLRRFEQEVIGLEERAEEMRGVDVGASSGELADVIEEFLEEDEDE